MYAAIRNHPLVAFEETYFLPLNHAFTGYAYIPTLHISGHLYGNYAQISTKEVVLNDTKLQYPCNLDESIKGLYMRLNNCFNYTTAAGDHVTEGNLVQIAYVLVTETGQVQEDCKTWQAKLDCDQNYMDFQAQFIKTQAYLHKVLHTFLQTGYIRGGVTHNGTEIHQAFSNQSQATAYDHAAVTNLTREKSTLSEKVALYTNRLFTNNRTMIYFRQ